ncbi:MAG: hypothetical protein HFI93_05760 [Lachnospiraceae bacterium]|nr:hypothetical protein [Lachnospiraceae bacterium]
MDSYEELLQTAADAGVQVFEHFDLNGDSEPGCTLKGLYIDGCIALDSTLKTAAEKSCVLAEELGHHYTTAGNILDLSDVQNRKQERKARMWGYNHRIGLSGILETFLAGCQNRYEMARHLDVTEEYLAEALEAYRHKYGEFVEVGNYILCFEPYLGVIQKWDKPDPQHEAAPFDHEA